MIIGLTGTNASGKGTVACYLVGKGYQYYSLSDELRKLLRKRNITATRDDQIREGRKYRIKYGNDFLASIVAKKIKSRNTVVDSIRNLGEVKRLQKLKNFYLISVDAPVKLRYTRSRKRGSKRDEKSLSAFIAKEKVELHGKGAEQQLKACMNKADVRITNSSTLANLYKKIDITLATIKNDTK